MRINFPGFTLPGFMIAEGQLLDITLLGVGIKIPPFDIVFWEEITFWEEFTIFDSEWVTEPVAGFIDSLRDTVASWFEGLWQDLTDAFNSLNEFLTELNEGIKERIHEAETTIARVIMSRIADAVREIFEALVRGMEKGLEEEGEEEAG